MFEQDRVLLRLQQRVLTVPEIKVCFLSGSYGRGTQDAFSDLDVALIFADEKSRAAAFEERRAFVRSVLPYVPAKSFDATHVRPYFHIALYSNGAKVDFRYETIDSLEPSVWDRDIHILKDSDGWGEAFQHAAQQLSGVFLDSSITDEELTALDERFWIMFMDVYRRILRGDSDKPYPIYLQLLGFTLPSLLRLLPAGDPAREALIGTAYSRDTTATAEHLRQLLGRYLAARQAIISRHRLNYEPNVVLEQQLLRKING